MPKSTTRILFFIAVACRIFGGFINPASHSSVTSSMGLQVLVGLILLLGWIILLLVGVIGALVKMAQLKRWGWFVALFFVLPVFVYIFWGPTDNKLPARTLKPPTR